MRSAWMALVLFSGGHGGCGRMDIDVPANPVEVTPGCPAVVPMTEITANASVCITINELGIANWYDASRECELRSLRQCKASEWSVACRDVPGLTDMFNDRNGTDKNWEWVQGLDGNDASVRGFETCDSADMHDATSVTHDIRCCAEKQ